MRFIAIVFWLLVLFRTAVFAQSTITEAQAVFLYNFTKMVEWPLADQQGEFVIGICGSSDLANCLKSYVKGKSVGKQPIKVLYFPVAETTNKCHMLFVSFGKTTDIETIKDRIAQNHTLLVSEKTGALNAGTAINFVVKDDKLKFELKTQNAAKYQLKVLSSLQQLAVVKY